MQLNKSISEIQSTSLDSEIREGLKGSSYSAVVEELGNNIAHNTAMKNIPRWHFAMLNDQVRNERLAKAIKSLDLEGKTVLDIGAGTGLLSMIAADMGAAHVYACEAVSEVADQANRIICKNGLQERITIIPKISTDLTLGVDVPERVDVIISETIDCGFVGEGFLVSLNHAKKELAKKEAAIMPTSFKLIGCMISSQEMANLNKCDKALGYDISAFNTLSTRGYFPVRSSTWRYKTLTEKEVFCRVDLRNSESIFISDEKNVFVQQKSQADGILFWFDCKLAENISITNDPDKYDGHWMQAFYPFNNKYNVEEGDLINVQITLAQNSAKFHLTKQL